MMTIGTVSELTGLSPRQLRYLEQKGLIQPARSTGGQRQYSNSLLPLLKQINNLRDSGLNLEEICARINLERKAPSDAAIWFSGGEDN